MSRDATYEEGAERPLMLRALDAEGLQVISALTQDAVLPITEMTWERGARRFALLLNRFRWEDMRAAERQGRPYERVRSVLAFEDVRAVASTGIDLADEDTVLSLLSVAFEPGAETTGAVELTLAGDGAVRLEVEALEAVLKDVTRPYPAPSGKAPGHE